MRACWATVAVSVPTGFDFQTRSTTIGIDLSFWGWSRGEYPRRWREISTMSQPISIYWHFGPFCIAHVLQRQPVDAS